MKLREEEKTIEEQIEAAEAQLAELKKAQLAKVEAEKEAAKLARKEEAVVVEQAITARYEVEAAAKKARAEAYKVYLEACDAEDAKVREAKEAEKNALKEFCEKHPEGFHTTIKLGDITYNYDYSENQPVKFVDPFKKLFNEFWFI